MLEEECWVSFHFTFLLSHTYLFQPISYSLAAGGSICWQGLFKHQQNACSYCSGWNWLLEPTQTALVWEPALGVWVRLFLVVCSYCSKNVSSFFSHSVHLCSCCLVFVQSLCLWTVQINSLNKFCGFLHFQLLFSLGFGVFPLYGFIFLSSFQLSKGMWHFVFGVGFLLVFFFSHEVKLDCGDNFLGQISSKGKQSASRMPWELGYRVHQAELCWAWWHRDGAALSLLLPSTTSDTTEALGVVLCNTLPSIQEPPTFLTGCALLL